MLEKIKAMQQLNKKILSNLTKWQRGWDNLEKTWENPDPALQKFWIDQLGNWTDFFPEHKDDLEALNTSINESYKEMMRGYHYLLKQACEKNNYQLQGDTDLTIDGFIKIKLDEIKNYAVINSRKTTNFFSLTYQYENIIADVLHQIIQKAEPQPFVTQTDLQDILSHLLSLNFYKFNAVYYPTEKWEWVKNSLRLWGNIATKFYDKVVDSEREIPISHVPRKTTQEGRVFLFAGHPRIVIEVTGSIVKTMRLSVKAPNLIAYESMGAATPPEVVQKALNVLQSPQFPNLPIHLDNKLCTLMKTCRQRFRGFDFSQHIPFEQENGRYCYYTFGGTWANELWAMALKNVGISVEVDSWRVYTKYRISSLNNLPTDIFELEILVQRNLPALIRRIQFSYHFYQLPKYLQQREIYSLLDLPQLAKWFAKMQAKTLVFLP